MLEMTCTFGGGALAGVLAYSLLSTAWITSYSPAEKMSVGTFSRASRSKISMNPSRSVMSLSSTAFVILLLVTPYSIMSSWVLAHHSIMKGSFCSTVNVPDCSIG
jgi:hypothetical protein